MSNEWKVEVNELEIITNERFKTTLKLFRALIIIGLIVTIFIVVFLIGILTYAKVQGPPPLGVSQSTIFYADDQTIIGESSYGQKRYWLPLDEISPTLIEATLAIEDRRFYEHHGFDFKRIAGAVAADIKARAKVQGASTITQQYARNLFLVHDKTWERKIYEALYTIRLEMNYSKKQILEGYLNTIYYGHGAYGVEAASHYYFGKSTKELTLSEAAMLAGIPKGPNVYSPFINNEKAKKRQNAVLQSMVMSDVLSEEQAKQAYDVKLTFKKNHEVIREDLAPYFQKVVNNLLKSQVGLTQREIETSGLHVYTTLNRQMQEIAEEQIKQTINPKSEIQIGLIAMNPNNGDVKALVGGRDFDESPFNRAVQAKRQPGSTFKPFLYYAALENGFTPSTELRSEPTTFRYDDNRATYTPQNYHNYYAKDPITLAQAIALSDNVYAVKTHLFLGMNELIKTAKNLGISSPLANVPSLALGTSPVKLVDMVSAYSILANGGKEIKPNFIKKIINQKGEVIYEQETTRKQLLDPKLAFVTSQLMTGMFDTKLNDYTSVTGQSLIKQLTRPYAGKSGTTKTDSWMIGFTPQLVTGVWSGYDKNKTIDLTAERSYSKNIWAGFMEKSLEGKPVLSFKPPEGVVGVYVNPQNGKLATEVCPVKRLTYFVEGTEPIEYCMEHIGHTPEMKESTDKKNSEKGWFKKLFDWF